MLCRIVIKSITNRKGRLVVAALAVLVAASMVSALAGISLDIKDKAGRQLRAYGANIVLVPRAAEGGDDLLSPLREHYLSDQDLAGLDQDPAVAGYAPYIFGLGEVDGRKVALVGTWFDGVRKVSPWWEVDGLWIASREDRRSSLVGSNAARVLGLTVGQNYRIAVPGAIAVTGADRGSGTRDLELTVAGIVKTGGQEDNQIFVDLGLVQETTGRRGLVSLVQVSALTGKRPVEQVAADLAKSVPGSRGQVVAQIAQAEGRLLGKIQWLMALVTAAILVAAGLSVGSTMTATVLERRKEVGLMKAMGADRTIAALIWAEALAVGLAGGVVGTLAGFGFSQVIGKTVFNTFISFRWPVLPLTLAAAVLVSWLGSRRPISQALGIDPVVTLRGE